MLTGYLGGAVATHVRIGSPFFTHTFLPIYVGVLVWGGLLLRHGSLRALIPLRTEGCRSRCCLSWHWLDRETPEIGPLFKEADQGKRELITSALTLLEVLGVPYRAGNRLLAERYEALLTRSRGIRLVELSHDQLRTAAQLRAATGVKTPGALQLVAAIGGMHDVPD